MLVDGKSTKSPIQLATMTGVIILNFVPLLAIQPPVAIAH